jgi:hypothetical protein
MRATGVLSSAAVLMTAAFAAASAHAATIGSTFDTDADGWVVGDDSANTAPGVATSAPNYISPDGYIQTGDIYANNVFLAPSKFLGDQSAFHNGTLTFSVFSHLSVDFNPATTVVLYSTAGNAIVYETGAAGTTFTDFTVPLAGGAGWTLYNGSQQAGNLTTISDATFQSYLSNITALAILADWHNGADDVGLDNVAFTSAAPSAAPIPAALPLFASALGGLGFAGWRRRKSTTAA